MHDIRAIFKTSDPVLKKYNRTTVTVGEQTDDETYHVTFHDGYESDVSIDELTFIRYFEACLEQNDGIRDSYSILFKAVTCPTNEEAEAFISKDIDWSIFKGVYDVVEWYRDEAEGSFDLSNEDDWPVLGLTA